MLPADAFAYGPEINYPPTDLMDEDIWNSITSLPDDVSLRTSGDYGSTLKLYWKAWEDWICLAIALQDIANKVSDSPIANCATAGIDEIQGSIYNVLVGFYRLSFSALRNMVEQITIGLALELSGNNKIFVDWLKGDEELKFGWASDLLLRNQSIHNMEETLMDSIGDSLFQQKTASNNGGFARRLFSELSQFTHGGPEFSNADLWEGSNGPIFVPKSFKRWSVTFSKAYTLCVLEAKLAKPTITVLGAGSKQTIGNLYRLLLGKIPAKEDGSAVFQTLMDLKMI